MTDKEIDREVKRRLAIFDPFGEHFGGLAEHGEHTAPTGRSAFRCLVPPHPADATVAEIGRHGPGSTPSNGVQGGSP